MAKTNVLEQYIIDTISVPEYFNKHVIGLKPGLTPLNDLNGSASLCPFHDDVNPSFRYWKVKKFFMCFGCGCAGDVINLHRLTTQRKINRAVTREAAIKDLCRIYNIKYVTQRKVRVSDTETVNLGAESEARKETVVEDISVFERCRRSMHLQSALVEHRKHFNLTQFRQRNELLKANTEMSLEQRFKAFANLDEMICTAINATEDRFEVAESLRLEDLNHAI